MLVRNGLGRNPRARPMLEGAVDSADVDFEWIAPPGGGFLGVSSERFDLYEYSFSGYLMSVASVGQEARDWVALPVFISRCFDVLAGLSAREDIEGWADLSGRRVIVPDVGMTAAIWMRVILRELFHIDPGAIRWCNSRQPEERHTIELGFKFEPVGLDIEQMSAGADPIALVAERDADVALTLPGRDANLPAGLRPLADALALRAMFSDLWSATGTTPVNHVLVARKSLLEEHPGLATQLYAMVEQSKALAYDAARRQFESLLFFPGAVIAEQAALFGDDPYPSGVRANRRMVELLMAQLAGEGQLPRSLAMDDIFTTELLDT